MCSWFLPEELTTFINRRFIDSDVNIIFTSNIDLIKEWRKLILQFSVLCCEVYFNCLEVVKVGRLSKQEHRDFSSI